MPLIHQVTEHNFLEERKKGEKIISKKFNKYDSLQQLDDDISLHKELAKQFQDPTIWAYATLKDKQTKPLRLFYYQDLFVNDKCRFVYVTASNQIGKTYGICVKALHHGLHVPNASVMIISKSEQQAVMVLDEIKWMLKGARIDYESIIGDIENRTELHIKGPNGSVSVIRCFPPTTKALGFPSTLTICDEINFWEKIGELTPIEYYDQVIEPRSNMTKSWSHDFLTMGQIIFISNPNGKKGIGWRTFNVDNRFNNYRYCWLAYPGNTIEEYSDAKNRLPPYRFASIFAAEYVSSEGGFISIEQYEQFESYRAPFVIPAGCTLFLGGDVGGEDIKSKNRDFNILYGVILIENVINPAYPRVRVVYRKQWPAGTKKQEIYNEIKRLSELEGVTIGMFGYDKVGVGDKMKNDLIDQGILTEYQIESLTYSLPNKSDVYINLQALFEQDMIEGTEIPQLKEQILGLEVKQPEGSVHLKIHHRTEGTHDDDPDALANACYVAKRSGAVPVGLSIVKTDIKESSIDEDCRHFKRHHDSDGELVCSECEEYL